MGNPAIRTKTDFRPQISRRLTACDNLKLNIAMNRSTTDPISERSDAEGFIEFNNIYNRYYPGFMRFAYSYLRDDAVAEDFVAEAFMAYWDHRRSMTPGSNIRAYILTVLKNKCLNYLKQKKFREECHHKIEKTSAWELSQRISTLEACDPDEIFSAEIQELVDKAIQSLPSKTIEVFILSRYQNKTNKEIAEQMHISVKGVEFHITKALNKLRFELKDYLAALIFLTFFH